MIRPLTSPLRLMFMVAFWVRLVAIRQSLWLDEAITAVSVQRYSLSELVSVLAPSDFHPPLYYLLMKVWTDIFGTAEPVLRLPSVIASLLAGWLIYRIGRQLHSETVGRWSATFFLFNPLIIYYSQEARMYMLVTLWLVTNLYALTRIQAKQATRWDWVLFGGTAILSLWTFYGSVFWLAALGLYLLWKREWRLAGVLAACSVGALGAVAPILWQQLQRSREALSTLQNWAPLLGTVTWKNLLLIPLKFSVGRISFAPKWLYYLLGGVWTLEYLSQAARGMRWRPRLGFLLLMPLALGIGFSLVSPLLQYFRFLYLIVPLSLLMAIGTMVGPWKRVVILAVSLAWAGAYLLFTPFHREDWRSLAAIVAESNLPVAIIPDSADPLRYYGQESAIVSLTDIAENPPTDPRLLVVPFTADIYGLDYSAELTKAGYTRESEHGVRGLPYQIWTR